MEIDVIELEVKLHLLAMGFSNTFFKTVGDNYQIIFENSNVVDEMEALEALFTKLAKRSPTKMILKDRKLVDGILENYTYLISTYRTIAKISEIPNKLKRYDMEKQLREWCKKVSGEELMNFGQAAADKILISAMAEQIDGISEHLKPTMSKYKTEQEKMDAIVKAEISKIFIKK